MTKMVRKRFLTVKEAGSMPAKEVISAKGPSKIQNVLHFQKDDYHYIDLSIIFILDWFSVYFQCNV